MGLAPGTRLGPYEVMSAIGAGGMGEVYRARDTRLNRTVAIKVLSTQFSADPDRLMRFDREAKTLASLNHPNVAQIYGTEHVGDTYALAMEFVDGEDLAQILARGPLPVDDALSIARQIAEALEAAHDLGIIHRDLKPANVKVRADETVKVLDFGLAKTLDGSRTASASAHAATIADLNVTSHPTLTSPAMTQMGMILGTAAYMSPEQAKGKPVDRGTDLWSFGAVLYEMLTGRAPFAGETVTDVIAAIVTRDPDWSALPVDTPPGVRRLLRRCLERDRRRRLADAGEARYQLEEAASVNELPQTAGPVTRVGRGIIPWAIAAMLAIVVAVLTIRLARQPVGETARYNLEPPPKARLSFSSRPAVAISGDGRTIVFVASVDGIDRLYVRRADAFEAAEVPGTENASNPALSPDGRTVVFAMAARLVKVSLGGGPVTTLANIGEPRGISWDEDGSILYAPRATSGIWRIPSAGGEPSAITTLASPAERTHRWPQRLPGGAVMFTVGSEASPDNYDNATVVAQMPDGSRHTVLTSAAMARYVPPAMLLLARGSTLFAVPFDPQKAQVTGTPVEILHQVAGDLTTGAHHFAASASGALVYISGRNAPGSTVPVWVHGTSGIEPLAIPPAAYTDLRLSPDGQQAAMAAATEAGSEIWVYHFQRRTFTKVTFGGQNVTPMWSRDAGTLYYSEVDTPRGTTTIKRRPADGSRQAESIATVPGRVQLNDLTPDGRALIVSVFGGDRRRPIAGRQSVVARLPIENSASATPLFEEGDEYNARISPDGRWVAYVGRTQPPSQIFVRPLMADGRWQVSTEGGEEPKWSRDGRHLYFRNETVLMGVTLAPHAATFEPSVPTQVVKGIYNLRTESGIGYDVDLKDERFLMLRPAEDPAGGLSLRVITNWASEPK